MRDLDVEALGGSARLAVDVPPTATGRPVAIRGRLAGRRRRGRAAHALRLGPLGIGTAATGELDVSWPKGRTRSLSGTLGVDLAPRDGRPLRLRRAASTGARRTAEQSYDRLELRGAAPRRPRERRGGRARPRAARARRATTNDLAELEAVLTRCRRALGNAEAQPAGFSGKGRFRGRWGGTLDWPVFDGRFEGEEIGYCGVDWGQRALDGQLRHRAGGGRVAPARRCARRRGELEWDGRSEIGWFGARDALARPRARDGLAGRGPACASWAGTCRRPGSSRAARASRGRRSDPEGEAQGTRARRALLRRRPTTRRASSRAGRARRAEVTRGEARLGGGGVRFAGSVTDDGVYDGSGEIEGRRARRAAPATAGAAARGPRLRHGCCCRARSRARAWRRRSLAPPLLRRRGDRRARGAASRATATAASRSTAAAARGRVDLALAGARAAPRRPTRRSSRSSARSTSLDPFLRVRPARAARRASRSSPSGEASIKGPLARPAELGAEAALSELELLLPSTRCGPASPCA